MIQALTRASAALVAALPCCAFALPSYSVSVIGSAGLNDNFSCSEASSPTGSSGAVSCNGAGDGQAAYGSAGVAVGTGHVGVSVSSTADASFFLGAPSGGALVHSSATGSLSDSLRIGSASQTGAGILTFRLYLGRELDLDANALGAAGQVQALGAAAADVMAVAFLGGQIFSVGQADGIQADYNLYAGGTTTTTSSGGIVNNVPVASGLGYHTFSVSFTFDQDFALALELRGHAFAQGSGNAAGGADLDAMNSLDWGGIVGISVGDQAVLDYTVISASGVDWTRNYGPTAQAVPELGTYGLILAGLAGIGLTKQRRRSGRS